MLHSCRHEYEHLPTYLSAQLTSFVSTRGNVSLFVDWHNRRSAAIGFGESKDRNKQNSTKHDVRFCTEAQLSIERAFLVLMYKEMIAAKCVSQCHEHSVWGNGAVPFFFEFFDSPMIEHVSKSSLLMFMLYHLHP